MNNNHFMKIKLYNFMKIKLYNFMKIKLYNIVLTIDDNDYL